MSEYKSVCILGRQPSLGAAELESLYGAGSLKLLDGAALLDVPAEEINFKRLGGTIKTARLLTVLPTNSWKGVIGYLADKIPEHLRHVPEGKFTLGLSAYGLDVAAAEINRSALELKKIIKKTGRPVRVVPNKTPALSSAQVLHNKLTHKGAWELLLIADDKETYLAQTLFVQDIDAYAARDQARPKRDSRVGMLPPKLAQIIINLAAGPLPKEPAPRTPRVLDPFCGTGVILQEALLMGCHVMGTDIDQRMADYAKANMRWLAGKYPAADGHVSIETADATNHKWPGFTAVASETYLGSPLSSLPPPERLRQITSNTNTVIKKFLQNLQPQLKPGQKICLAVPAWRKPDGSFVHLPLLDKLTDMGYTYSDLKHVRRQQLIYYRENQVVARQLLRIEKG